MSEKNTNNRNAHSRISYGQYKLLDLFLFLSIMCVCEIVNVLAVTSWLTDYASFTVSVMLLVSLVVIVRWGWLGLIFPVADGLLYCWLLGADLELFVIYAVGNAFVAFAWFFLKLVGREKVISRWWLTAIYALIGFVLLILGRSLVGLFFGNNFFTSFVSYIQVELIDLIFAMVGLLILRKFENMLVDQKQYLLKVVEERDNVKPAGNEYYWDGYTELNSEDLEKLKAMDEYDRSVTFNRGSLKRLKEQTEGNLDGGYAENTDEDELSLLDGGSTGDTEIPDEDDLSRLDGE